MTSPQDPWQQQGQSGQIPPHPQQGGYHPSGPSSGGFPNQGGYYPPGYQNPGHPGAGYPQQPGYPVPSPYAPNPYAPGPYAAPPVSAGETAAPESPATITAAFWIAMVVPVVVTVLYAVNMLMGLQLINEAINTGGVGATGEMRQVATGVGTVLVIMFGFFIVLYAVLTGLWILFGFKMRAGRNWARVTLTVFASLWGLAAVVALVSGGVTFESSGGLAAIETPAALLVLGYVQNALSLFAMISFVVLVFLRPSNWFFRAAAHR